jgi:hypothetical protein
MTERLGDAPIEAEYHEKMSQFATSFDAGKRDIRSLGAGGGMPVSLPKDPILRTAWVMLAALLALTDEHCGDDKLAALKLSMAMRRRGAQKKLEAYMRDPANRDKIIARHRQAAEMLGLTGETRH